MDTHININFDKILSPERVEACEFRDPKDAVAALEELYNKNVGFLRNAFESFEPSTRHFYRVYYPEICISCHSFGKVDPRLSFGHFSSPGVYSATITDPKLFRSYLIDQLEIIQENHEVLFVIGESQVPIPLHFAIMSETSVSSSKGEDFKLSLRDHFDTPELATLDDSIVHGTYEPKPLAPFTAQRVDYSLARLAHYTATEPEHF